MEYNKINNEIVIDTLTIVELWFATHFGTYTNDTTVKVAEVFDVLKEIKEGLLEDTI